MKIKLKRTDSTDKDFIYLVGLLDQFIVKMDGKEHVFYAQFNTLDEIRHVLVAYDNDKPVSCGAIKSFAGDTMEVKRMFTLPEYRHAGLATAVLTELEKWTTELG